VADSKDIYNVTKINI